MTAVTFNIISGFIKATVQHAGYYARRARRDPWLAYMHSTKPVLRSGRLKTMVRNQCILHYRSLVLRVWLVSSIVADCRFLGQY